MKHGIGVSNGSDAIVASLMALDISPGDEVIVPTFTFFATAGSVLRVGARPVLVDILSDTFNIDPEAVADAVTKRTRAIIPVHLYGLPVDMAPLMTLAQKYGIPVVEDACQAHGAWYKWDGSWRRAGSLGDAAAFSFYASKNLGAMGDAGAVVTNQPVHAQEIRLLRDHGSHRKYIHLRPDGWNSRLDAIQAAVLSAKLKRLDEWNEMRRQAAQHYTAALSGLPLELPVEPDYARHVYHLYVVRSFKRDMLYEKLMEAGVGVGLHYPIPIHRQEAYTYLGFGEGSFPNAERSAATLLSLPMHPMLTQDQIQHVARVLGELL